jgi:hypothetical protein
MAAKSHHCYLVLVTAVALANTPAFGAVVRCDVGGKAVYQNPPCPEGASASVELPSPRTSGPSEDNAAKLERESALGHVGVGMSVAQLTRAWGRPSAINSTVNSSGQSDQYVYRKSGGDQYVYVRNGVVESVSFSSQVGYSAPVAAPQRAPSQEEIDARERADKAGERRFVRERTGSGELLRRIGPPDTKQYAGGLEYWIYYPTGADPQTATRYVLRDGWVIDIVRRVSQ